MEDACELGRRAIYHATFRDAVSGGTVSGASYGYTLNLRVSCHFITHVAL